MRNPAHERAELAFAMYFKNREQLQSMVDCESIHVDKGTMFVLHHLLNGNIESVDFELYSEDINLYYSIYKSVKEMNKPIHGDFYPELRQRYFDLLDSIPIENSSEPLSKSHLSWMLVKLSDDMSETKKHRWLGYIQGCMTFYGLINVNEERDATRQLFNGK